MEAVKHKVEPSIVVSKLFADVFQAYLECSDEVQAVICDMVRLYNASGVTDDEKEAAAETIAEALFPYPSRLMRRDEMTRGDEF